MEIDASYLKSMVMEVNATQLVEKDKLTDNVYHYDKEDKVFELAEKTAGRKLAQQMEKKAEMRAAAEKKFQQSASSCCHTFPASRIRLPNNCLPQYIFPAVPPPDTFPPAYR